MRADISRQGLYKTNGEARWNIRTFVQILDKRGYVIPKPGVLKDRYEVECMCLED